MSDLTITRSGELMVASIQGETVAGTEFVDGYFPPNTDDLYVVDAGKIILPERELDRLRAAAKKESLTIAEEQAGV